MWTHRPICLMEAKSPDQCGAKTQPLAPADQICTDNRGKAVHASTLRSVFEDHCERAPSASDTSVPESSSEGSAWQPGNVEGVRTDPGTRGTRGPKSIAVSYHLSECNRPSDYLIGCLYREWRGSKGGEKGRDQTIKSMNEEGKVKPHFRKTRNPVVYRIEEHKISE